MVALTGIERAKGQFSSVQFGLSRSVCVQTVRRRWWKCRHESWRWQRGGRIRAEAQLAVLSEYLPGGLP